MKRGDFINQFKELYDPPRLGWERGQSIECFSLNINELVYMPSAARIECLESCHPCPLYLQDSPKYWRLLTDKV